jgi:hypothetical protein
MRFRLWVAAAAASALVTAISAGAPASAQKAGGVFKLSHFDSPASMSILEESTRAALQPMMGVFNNLVMYDQLWLPKIVSGLAQMPRWAILALGCLTS